MQANFLRRQRNNLAAQWVVLLALVWSQLAFAVHHVEHHGHDDHGLEHSESCSVCIQFERDAHTACDAPQIVPQSLATLLPLVPLKSVAPSTIAVYSARASP